MQCVLNGDHVCEIITILVMLGKKRTIVINKNKCRVSYFGGVKDSHLVTQLTKGHLIIKRRQYCNIVSNNQKNEENWNNGSEVIIQYNNHPCYIE